MKRGTDMDKENELEKELFRFSKKVLLAPDRYLTCSDEEISINVSTMFTFLSVSSTIMLTEYLEKRLGLMQLHKAHVNYLLTRETSEWSYSRLALSNFAREHDYRKRKRIFQWR